MKISILALVGVVVVSSFTVSSAQASTSSKSRKLSSEQSLTTSQAASRRSSDSDEDSKMTWGAGVASVSYLPGFPGGFAAAGWIGLNDKMGIEPLLEMNTTGTFQFGAGGTFKYTLLGNSAAGFHVGAGFGIGNVVAGGGGAFFLTFPLIGGFHFALPGVSQVHVHVDAGAQISPAGGPVFAFGSQSAMLGLSLLYLF